jgi:hypothetical protein
MANSAPRPSGLAPCTSSAPPELPGGWYAVALLTPFTSAYPAVAEVTYSASLRAMVIGCYDLGGGGTGVLVLGDGTYFVYPNWPDTGPAYGPFSNSRWQVPAPDWLADKQLQCMGTGAVLGVDCEWWGGLTPCTNGGGTNQVGAWIWADTAQRLPFRIMFIDQSNPYRLPVLGDAAMVHLPTFENHDGAGLEALVAETRRARQAPRRFGARSRPAAHARRGGAWSSSRAAGIAGPVTIWSLLEARRPQISPERRAANLARVGELIPGLRPLSGGCTPYSLPTWPGRLAMTALTIPTGQVAVYPTEVFYDWSLKRQASRFYEPDGSRMDTILEAGITYDVTYHADGSHSCDGTDPVGLPRPNWPAADNCQCRAAIVDHPRLSPGRTTVIFTCPSDPPRVFWIWYTDDGAPVMFSEVPQHCGVTFTLIDYASFDPNPGPFPAGVFDVPADCLQKK